MLIKLSMDSGAQHIPNYRYVNIFVMNLPNNKQCHIKLLCSVLQKLKAKANNSNKEVTQWNCGANVVSLGRCSWNEIMMVLIGLYG